jgi:hypothetical protein
MQLVATKYQIPPLPGGRVARPSLWGGRTAQNKADPLLEQLATQNLFCLCWQ